jgi:hypothetical protein
MDIMGLDSNGVRDPHTIKLFSEARPRWRPCGRWPGGGRPAMRTLSRQLANHETGENDATATNPDLAWPTHPVGRGGDSVKRG